MIIDEGFKTLDNGARVSYQVRDGRNGQEAFDVRVVGYDDTSSADDDTLRRLTTTLHVG